MSNRIPAVCLWTFIPFITNLVTVAEGFQRKLTAHNQ